MSRRLITFFLLAVSLDGFSAQIVLTGHSRKNAAAPCIPPALVGDGRSQREAAYNSANTCNGSACTNGASLTNMPNLWDVNDGLSQGTLAQAPIYTTGAVNGLPAGTFTRANTSHWSLTTGYTGWGNNTVILTYVVIKPTSLGGTIVGFNGPSFSHGFEWYVNAGAGMGLNASGLSLIGTDTTVISTSAFSTLALTYDHVTLKFYHCSGGTCNVTATVSSTTGFSTSDQVGWNSVSDPFFDGQIAEIGFVNSTTTASLTTNLAGIAAWSQCKYGI